MTAELVLSEANEEQRRATVASIWPYWGEGLQREEFIESRLASPRYARSQRYVGLADGELAVSLACYPMVFRLHGQPVAGVSIGAVYTVDRFRRRGYASQLMRFVDNENQRRGRQLSLLYSAIPAQFYERLGYITCDSLQGTQSVDDLDSNVDGIARLKLAAFAADDELSALEEAYCQFQQGLALSIDRDREYWQYTLAQRPDDEFFWMLDDRNKRVGYVRVARVADTLRLVDFTIQNRDPDLERAMYWTLLTAAHKRGLTKIDSWLPHTPVAQRSFDSQTRSKALTMVKPLDESLDINDAVLRDSGWLVEVDHV